MVKQDEDAIVKEANTRGGGGGGGGGAIGTTSSGSGGNSNNRRKAVLTAPLKLEGDDKDEGEDYRAPNILQRVLGLLKNVRPGTDLTRFQVPPVFNIPKSMLQLYGEPVYCVSKDQLGQCANGRSPIDRFIAVVAWNISTLRPLMFGVSPYNPILGETHHVSRGTLNVLIEQVSHHPPVSALHATDDKNGIEMIWCQHAVPKFIGTQIYILALKDDVKTRISIPMIIFCDTRPFLNYMAKKIIPKGPELVVLLALRSLTRDQTSLEALCNCTSVETVVKGQRELKLLKTGENYVVGTPNLVIRFLPVPGVHWSGNIRVHCQETGLEAELCFGGSSFLSRRANQRSIRGEIFMSSSRKTIYEVNGHWDRLVTVKDVSNGKLTVIYDATNVLSGLKTPILKDPEGLWPSESAVVWAEVSQSILSKCWEKAREAKTAVEEKERELLKERKEEGEIWVPKHFTVSYSKEDGWNCLPIQRLVTPAPIVVPF